MNKWNLDFIFLTEDFWEKERKKKNKITNNSKLKDVE